MSLHRIAFPLCALGAGSPYCSRNFQCKTPAATQNQPPAARLSHNVMAVDPNVSTSRPMPRSPDVIGAAHVITSPASIVRSIADLDRDSAWAIAGVSGITRSVWATSVIRPTVRRVSSVIISASACAQRDGKEQKQKSRPSRSRFRSSLGGDYLRVINNVGFHIMV